MGLVYLTLLYTEVGGQSIMMDFDRHGLEGDGRCCCLREEKEEGALPSLIELKEQKSDQKN